MNIKARFLNRINQSEFTKNVATLATGTTLAQAVSIFTAPVLYRIYSKVDYGTLGLYMAITGVIGVFSTMQYLQPILLEKEDDEAKKVMWLNRVINTGVTLFVLLLVLILGKYLGQWLNNEDVVPWLYLVPLSIFFSGQNEIFRVWANRKKKFKIMSFNAILTAILVPAISITVGVFNNGPLGLFLGLLTSQVVPPIVLLVALTRNENLGLKYFSWSDIKIKAKFHSKFPYYSLPAEFINRFINQLPVFMLSAYAGSAVVGTYNLCVRMLGLPIQLIGSAIGEVYKQRAAQDYNETGNYRPIFLKTFNATALASIMPLFILVLYAPNLFSLFFGEQWVESGIIASFMAPVFALRFINSPLSYGFFIHKKQHIDLFASVIFGIGAFLCFYFGFSNLSNYLDVLKIFALFYSITYLIMILYNFKLAQNEI